MSGFRVPFDRRVTLEETTVSFDAGVALGLAAETLGEGEGAREGTVDTPWGTLHAEVNERGLVLAALPSHEESDRPVMLQAACRVLGIDPGPVRETGVEMRVVDVGRDVLVVPVVDEDALEALPPKADASGVPGHKAEGGVAYVHTQTSPYARVVARVWGERDALASLGAVGVHLVRSGGMRATFPRTRIVASVLGEEGECEVIVQARKAGGQAVVERVLVGGQVARA